MVLIWKTINLQDYNLKFVSFDSNCNEVAYEGIEIGEFVVDGDTLRVSVSFFLGGRDILKNLRTCLRTPSQGQRRISSSDNGSTLVHDEIFHKQNKQLVIHASSTNKQNSVKTLFSTKSPLRTNQHHTVAANKPNQEISIRTFNMNKPINGKIALLKSDDDDGDNCESL